MDMYVLKPSFEPLETANVQGIADRCKRCQPNYLCIDV